MSTPCKPWESGRPSNLGLAHNSQTAAELLSTNPMFGQGMHSSAPLGLQPAGGVAMSQGPPMQRVLRQAPPVPPPVSGGLGYQGQTSAMGYSAPYSSYGASSYGMGGYGASSYGMGGYSSYGGGYGGGYGGSYGGGYSSLGYGRGYGTSMGGYGMNRYPPGQHPVNNLESRFIQMAEEGSRPAFESIESLVQTFGSINFMMESTFGALYSSFRAVLGVAENFGRLRTLFGQVFSTFAVLRTFQWIYKKLLYYLGLRPENPGREFIWQQAAGIPPVDPAARRTFWPVALFLGLVCSGPYLVWKLLNSLNVIPSTDMSAVSNPRTWAASPEPTLIAVCRYAFEARNNSELSVQQKQKILIAPPSFQTTHSDWLTASDGRTVGLVPKNYVQVIAERKRETTAEPVSHPPPTALAPTFPVDLEASFCPEPLVANANHVDPLISKTRAAADQTSIPDGNKPDSEKIPH